MAIKGKIRVTFTKDRIKNMEVGSIGYLNFQDIIITKENLSVDLNSEIFYELEEDFFEDCFVVVTRTGSGLTPDDFDLDFSKINEEISFEMENAAMQLWVLSEYNRFLVFNNVKYEEDSEECKKEVSIIDQKEAEFKKAIEEEDYEKAKKLREEIEKLCNPKEEKSNTRKLRKD